MTHKVRDGRRRPATRHQHMEEAVAGADEAMEPGTGIPTDLGGILGRSRTFAAGVRSVEPLVGGLTNTNYKVVTDHGSFVVRIGGRGSEHLAIDREHEYENSLAAAESGIGAPVVERLEDPSVLVVGYIEGRTLSARDLRDGPYMERIASACRQLHQGRPFRGRFDMFALQRRYLAVVRRKGFRLPSGYLEFSGAVEDARRAMAVRPEAPLPCNNDLLAENFIDDGEKIWIIDYEYSGNNEPSFELGNVWSESDLSLEQLEALVGAYYGTTLRDKVARARLWGLMSKYGWTLWASIQSAVSDTDFDFWEWGMEKYERAVAEFGGPDFDRLLADVALGEGDRRAGAWSR